IWGLAYGAVLWFVGPLTVQPLILTHHLGWDLASAQAAFPNLTGQLIYGAMTALVFAMLRGERQKATLGVALLTRGMIAGLLAGWLLGLLLQSQNRLLELAGVVSSHSTALAWLIVLALGGLAGLAFALLYPDASDGAGRSLIRGTVSGFLWLVVGLVYLPSVARRVGSTSAGTGFTVELIISFLIGSSYGLLFRHQSFDLGSALCWGMSYGVFWWILGPLTLLPILLGTSPRWSIGVV